MTACTALWSPYFDNNREWRMLNWCESGVKFLGLKDKMFDPYTLAKDLELEAEIELIAPGYSFFDEKLYQNALAWAYERSFQDGLRKIQNGEIQI